MTLPPERVSVTTELKIVEAKAGLVSRIVVGVFFMAGGTGLVWFGLTKENHRIALIGLGVAIMGGLFLPSVFDVGQKIYITFFPNGLPLLGGRRITDPPAPKQEFHSETPQPPQT